MTRSHVDALSGPAPSNDARLALAGSVALLREHADALASDVATAVREAANFSKLDSLQPTLAPLIDRTQAAAMALADASLAALAGGPNIDRAALGQLTDSLLHIVRNAVDHGVETPAERVAQGKPERATIRFDARQVGSDVVIAVADDGRGINTAALRREAARHGVGTDPLTDDEVNGLIFQGGISTAATLSQTLGRSVGRGGRIDPHGARRRRPGRRLPRLLETAPCRPAERGGRRCAGGGGRGEHRTERPRRRRQPSGSGIAALHPRAGRLPGGGRRRRTRRPGGADTRPGRSRPHRRRDAPHERKLALQGGDE